MFRKTLTTLTLICFLFTPIHAQSIAENFQLLRDFVSSPELPPEERVVLGQLLDFAELQANNSLIRASVAERLLEAFFIQLVVLALFEEEQNMATAGAGAQEEDPFDAVLKAVDSIHAQLFFALPPQSVLAEDPPAPAPEACGVRILVQTLGPVLSDPAGTYFVTFGDIVRAEAFVSLEGGAIQWKIEPEGDELGTMFFTQGQRAVFRAADSVTLRLTASYTDPEDRQCQDSIWVQVQGPFGGDDDGGGAQAGAAMLKRLSGGKKRH